MVKILIGICCTRQDNRFLESFNKFFDSCSERYNISVNWQYNKFLPDAQNLITDIFMDGNYTHLLLLDDDHWGHKVEMLDCLLNADVYVATMKTYSRHYPYVCAAWNWVNENTTIPIELGDGYVECDLTGFPMTLIKRSLFDKIDKPYFRMYSDGDRDWHSDIDFFKRLNKIGIKPIVCFQYCLNHDKITQENVYKYRYDERLYNNNIGWYNLINSSVNNQITKTKPDMAVS